MTTLVSLLFIAMIPIDCKITKFSLHLYYKSSEMYFREQIATCSLKGIDCSNKVSYKYRSKGDAHLLPQALPSMSLWMSIHVVNLCTNCIRDTVVKAQIVSTYICVHKTQATRMHVCWEVNTKAQSLNIHTPCTCTTHCMRKNYFWHEAH